MRQIDLSLMICSGARFSGESRFRNIISFAVSLLVLHSSVHAQEMSRTDIAANIRAALKLPLSFVVSTHTGDQPFGICLVDIVEIDGIRTVRIGSDDPKTPVVLRVGEATYQIFHNQKTVVVMNFVESGQDLAIDRILASDFIIEKGSGEGVLVIRVPQGLLQDQDESSTTECIVDSTTWLPSEIRQLNTSGKILAKQTITKVEHQSVIDVTRFRVPAAYTRIEADTPKDFAEAIIQLLPPQAEAASTVAPPLVSVPTPDFRRTVPTELSKDELDALVQTKLADMKSSYLASQDADKLEIQAQTDNVWRVISGCIATILLFSAGVFLSYRFKKPQ